MTADFKNLLKNYATLLIKVGVNLQKGQILNIQSEPYHREFAYMLGEEAYKAGAKYVNINLVEPRLQKLLILEGSSQGLDYTPPHLETLYRDIVKVEGANLSIVGAEDPDLLVGLNPEKINRIRLARYKALKFFYDEGIGKSKVQWLVAAAATGKWGQKIYKECSPAEAEERLWQSIFKICHVDRPDFMEWWENHDRKLTDRSEKLNTLRIKTLHFTSPGTDLKVGLTPLARFKGGGELSKGGISFQPNIPTEECFTTPDCRLTEGHVQTTRPFFINGELIKGLYLEFEDGTIKNFRAEKGEETFRTYINSDKGARRLGEVALVGTDSAVYQSGEVFEEILFDENAACHIAVGMAYDFCIEGTEKETAQGKESIGFNESSVHTDMMISSEETDVMAYTFDDRKVPLIVKGEWTDF